MSRIFRERPDYIYNDVIEIRKLASKGLLKPKDIKAMIRYRKVRIKELEEQIKQLMEIDEKYISRIEIKE